MTSWPFAVHIECCSFNSAMAMRHACAKVTTSSIPGIWETHGTLERARAAVKHTYHDDSVLRTS